MTVGKKLYLGTSTAVVATLLLGGTAWYALEQLGGTVDKLVNINAKRVYLSGDINTAMSDVVAEERATLFAGSRHDAAGIARANDDFKTSTDRLNKDLQTLVPLLETEEGRKAVSEMQGAYSEILSNHKTLIVSASGADPEAAVKLFEEKILPVITRINSCADNLAQFQNTLLSKVSSEAAATLVANKWLTVILLLISALAGVVLFVIVRKLDADISGAVTEIAQSAREVDTASVQIATSSQRLAQASCEQAASIEETSASTEEIGSMTRRNSENSKSAAELVDKSVQGFDKSNRQLDEMLGAMEGISESSNKISRIIKVIDEIAFQTNILALNAAVEAARAGEAGMGFAVVADEVRNLAQRCAQAAKDTAALIEDSIAKSRDGKSKVSETATSIRYVSEQAGQIKTLIDEVTLGSVEQTRGAEQISKALSQMDQATQSSAANAEESASASQELQGQAASLRVSIQRVHFMFTGKGETGVKQMAAAPAGAKASAVSKPAAKKFSTSVSALKGATGRSTAPAVEPKAAPMSFASATASRDEFPLEESFTEF